MGRIQMESGIEQGEQLAVYRLIDKQSENRIPTIKKGLHEAGARSRSSTEQRFNFPPRRRQSDTCMLYKAYGPSEEGPHAFVFLKKRGLKLSQEKTRIININDGITFLGWKIFKKNENIKRIPTQESKNRLFEKIKVVLNQNHISEKEKAKRLKQIITGWLNFYSIATYPFFLNIEYELIMFINQFAGMRYLAGVIHQIFEKFER